MSKPLVEVLTSGGCPHAEPAFALVERLIAASGISATVRCVDVLDAEEATAQRFLGSPTIRVNGRDIEPGADARAEYGLSCRIYRTDAGITGELDEQWLREALSAGE
jgi:hypothetical protein